MWTINKLAGVVGGLVVIASGVITPMKYFQSASAAEASEQKIAAQQQSDKAELSKKIDTQFIDLNLKIARGNIARLNSKQKLTEDDKVELQFNRELVIELQKKALAQ